MLPIPLDAVHEFSGPLLIGFSGGLDSTVLLHRLARDPALHTRKLSALHIHHGLNPCADDWQRHCMHVCADWKIPLRCIKVEVPQGSRDGLEAAARNARHAAFAEELPTNGILLLAHHQDDQAETVLLRALRGSGVDGLAAMRPWRAYAGGWLWRPLLDIPRAHLLDYARRHDLDWIEDPSNANTHFDRNYLRRVVMPTLTARWSHAPARLARVATLQAQAQELLDADIAVMLSRCLADTADTLSVPVLCQFPPARRARLLRAWVSQLDLPPLPGHAIDRIEQDLLVSTPGEHANFCWQKAIITRWRDLLHASSSRAPLPTDFNCQWHPRKPLFLPDGHQLALMAKREIPADLVWQVHARRGGERIVLPGRAHSHSLKHVLQQRLIPPWTRCQLPLISNLDGTLMAAGEYIYSAAFANWLKVHQARLTWK